MSIESIVANLRRFRLGGAQEAMTTEERLRKQVIDFGIYEISRDGGWPDAWVRGELKTSDKAIVLLQITNHIYGFALRKGFKEKDLSALAEATLTEMQRRVAGALTAKGKRK